MTNIEKEKCEELCKEALTEIQKANDYFKKNDEVNHDCSLATADLRWGDRKTGYAEGIYQVLVSLGYESEDMKKLSKLI